MSVIHKGDWKLHLYHEEWQLDGGRDKLATNHAVELYNLREDVGERHDLGNSNPVKRDELLGDLFAWLNSTNALLPAQPNPTYDPAAVARSAGHGSRTGTKKKANATRPGKAK